MNRYVVLVHDSDDDAWETATEEEKQVVYGGDEDFGRQLAERGGAIVGGNELTHRRRARVRRRGESVVTEGTFAQTTEVLSGYMVVECPDEAVLLELTELLARVHDVVEVRPV